METERRGQSVIVVVLMCSHAGLQLNSRRREEGKEHVALTETKAKVKTKYRRGSWIGFDFDGTLCNDKGEPVAAVVTLAKAWLAAGYEVRVVTARVGPQPVPSIWTNVAAVKAHLEDWTAEHIGQPLRITCKKDYEMLLLYDDRVVRVETDTGKILSVPGAQDIYPPGYELPS